MMAVSGWALWDVPLYVKERQVVRLVVNEVRCTSSSCETCSATWQSHSEVQSMHYWFCKLSIEVCCGGFWVRAHVIRCICSRGGCAAVNFTNLKTKTDNVGHKGL